MSEPDGQECTRCEGTGQVDDPSACGDLDHCAPVRTCSICGGTGRDYRHDHRCIEPGCPRGRDFHAYDPRRCPTEAIPCTPATAAHDDRGPS